MYIQASMETACLRVAIVVTVIQLTSAPDCETKIRPPLCDNQDAVLFIEYPQNVTVPCKNNMTAEFPCQYTYHNNSVVELPPWTIGSTTYSADCLPLYHSFDGSTKVLYVRNISLSQNNTVYICEFHTQEDGQFCVYQSKPGSIIIVNSCEVTEFQSVPYYQYISATQQAVLKHIVTTISKRKLEYFINVSISYTINFSDSISGVVCHNKTFPVDDDICNHDVCVHNFIMSASKCLDKNASIYVSVSVTEYRGRINFSLTDPIKVDTVNKFVDISFDKRTSMFNCSFNERSRDSKKVCSISTGPVTANSTCDDSIQQSEPVRGEELHSRYVKVGVDLNFSDHMGATKFCFVANASVESKAVIVGGIYDTASSPTIHYLSIMSRLVTTTLTAIIGIVLKFMLFNFNF